MKLRFSALALTIILPACLSDFPTFADDLPLLSITTDRTEAIYESGEEITFTIRSNAPAGSEITWTTSLDGYRNLDTGRETPAATEPVTVKGSLSEPGFLLLTATVTPSAEKPFTVYGAAGVSPSKITPSLPVPDDFDAFWAKQKDRLASVPMTIVSEPVTLTAAVDGALEAFDITVPAETDGPPVSGYFAKPKGAGPKSLPAVLWVHGAGVRGSSLPASLGGARDGFLSLDINAHGLPNGKPDEFYKEIAAGDLKTYRIDGNRSRDEVYFRGMFVRLQRALDFLTAQAEWNGKTLAVIGHSQGGYQAIVAGGLDPRVTFIGSGVPAGCDHSGMKADRISGWPKIVALLPGGEPDPVSLEACRYVDAVNFATRCKAEAILSVGFIDRTCPPTSIYAAYNVLAGPKSMISRPAMAHAAPEDIRAEFRLALLKHAGLSVPAPVAVPAAVLTN